MNTKLETWTHNCPSTGKFIALRFNEICPQCLTNYEIHSLRHDGFLFSVPSLTKTLIQLIKVKIAAFAALLAPKKIKKTRTQPSEEQTQHLYRNG